MKTIPLTTLSRQPFPAAFCLPTAKLIAKDPDGCWRYSTRKDMKVRLIASGLSEAQAKRFVTDTMMHHPIYYPDIAWFLLNEQNIRHRRGPWKVFLGIIDGFPVFRAKVKGDEVSFTCPRCRSTNHHGYDGEKPFHRISHCSCWRGYLLSSHELSAANWTFESLVRSAEVRGW